MPPPRRPVLASISNGMHIFERRYFNINRRFLMYIGLWPYEVETKKYVLRTVTFALAVLYAIPQLISMVMYYKNIDRLMLNTVTFFVQAILILKMTGMILAEENMKELHRSIANNWQRLQDYSERKILHEYSERARTATITYIALVVSSAVIVTAVPLIPKVLDAIRPLKNPRPGIYVSEGEFLIDRESHFFLLLFVDYIAFMLITLNVIAIDTMYIVSVEHCCALYAITRSRLLKLKPMVEKRLSSDEDVDSYEWLRHTIQLHQSALTCTSLLDDSYSLLFLFIAIAGLFSIPLISCAVIAHLDEPLHIIPYAVCLVVFIINGLVLCYPGQRLIDHQLNLLDAAYCNEWYSVPLRTKKLLLIFILRCSQPVIITAGNLLPMTLEVYFKVMKTAISYITVAASFR